jgi:carboxylate-amine ligase
MIRHLLSVLARDAEELGCAEELAGIEDLIETGTGARRQLRMFARNGDLRDLVREVAARTLP